MKTKDLINELKKADPTGENEVVVCNKDIYFIESLPAYYDGSAEKLIFSETGDKMFPIAGKFVRKGIKIQINTLSLQDAAQEYYEAEKDFPIDLSECGDGGYEKERIKMWKIESGEYIKNKKI